MRGEAFEIVAMLAGSYVLIRFLAWILGGMGDAGLLVYGDWPFVPEEMKPAAAISELPGGRSSQERRRVSNAFKQEDTLNNQCPRGAGL